MANRMSIVTQSSDGINFAADFQFVQAAVAAVSSILGSPDSLTKKVIRWERSDVFVNIFREVQNCGCLCVAGDRIKAGGTLNLDSTNDVVFRSPPKNSNCSVAIKLGPTLWLHATTAEHFAQVARLLSNFLKDNSDMNESDQNQYDIESEEEIVEETEEDALELSDSDRRLSTQPLDLSIDTLVTRIQRHSLILQPEFQRDYVWSSSKASQLIESVLMRIPLPIVYLAETPDSDWEVVDGQQRLTALNSFVVGHFPDGSTFRLGRLNVRSDLTGKAFKDLTKADQNLILNYTIRAIILLNDSHADVKFEVFERLNCGSVQLKDAELRNCMYRGSYNDMLNELAKNTFMLKIRKAVLPHKRMDDRQLILRFLAMKRNTHLNYRGPMKQFMNREMEGHRHATQPQIAVLTRQFEDAIESAWIVFGENAFRRWNSGGSFNEPATWDSKINVALWDTLLYGLAFYEKRQIVPAADAIREEFLDLMAHDPKFVDYIGRSTDKPERLQYRAKVWLERLAAVITIPAGETRTFSRKLKSEMHALSPACAICDQHIQSPDDAEIDHVTNYWRGGSTIPDNARLTHRHCNRARGGRLD